MPEGSMCCPWVVQIMLITTAKQLDSLDSEMLIGYMHVNWTRCESLNKLWLLKVHE